MKPTEEHIRALIVDDDAGVRTAVASVLESVGHEALCASNCAEAWTLMNRHRVGVSILDVHIRHESGLVLAGELMSRFVHLPVILMSGEFTIEILNEARSRGVLGCLAKPLDLGSLRRAVRLAVHPKPRPPRFVVSWQRGLHGPKPPLEGPCDWLSPPPEDTGPCR